MAKAGDFFQRLKPGRKAASPLEILHASPLFDPAWYRETNPDLRGKPIDAAKHYLEHGAAEGRNPSPLFDTKWYLQQNPDVAVSGGNPFVHYVLRGQREGRAARPPDLNGAHAVADATAAVFTTQSSQISEPGIKPPPLLPAGRLSVTEICRRNAKSVAAIRALKERNGVTGGQSQFADLCAAKMSLGGDGDGLSSAQIGAAFAEISESGEQTSWADIVAGLGVTPNKFLKESHLPEYYVPILQRYNEGRFEVTRRFELDPSKSGSVKDGPRISLLVPVYKTPIVFLERAILSVVFQTYANWELILVDDRSQRSDVEAVLRFYENVDPRIKVQFRSSNNGISAASNDALALAGGEYIGLLDHDDMLTRDALEKIAARLVADQELDFVYTDECKIDRDDIADDLFYKPDWSPILLLNFMYTGHFTVYRKTLVERVGGFRSQYDFSQDYDLALRIAEQQPKVAHIDECLYGWRMIPGSGASGDRPDARASNIAALQSAIDRRGYGGVAIALPTANRVKRQFLGNDPLVSIVVPSAGQHRRVKATIESIREQTLYANYEVIFVTSSSAIDSFGAQFKFTNVRFVNFDRPFNFSEKCNIGAEHARGEYLIFYNDDVLVISPDWIGSILECLTLPGVGGVSPKLLYENGTIQYAGMVTGVRRLTGTAFHTYPAESPAYFNMAQSMREVSILSGACLAISRSILTEVGGWNEHDTPYAHTDVDLCFRIRDHGYSCIYTPHADLTHIGHVAMGADEAEAKKAKFFKKDKGETYVLKRWGSYYERDPYFPPKMRDLLYTDSQEEFIFDKSRATIPLPTGKDFILFSHDLSASGAPRCLYEIAKVLIEAGHYVLVVSPEDGRFRKRFIEIGADVIVDPLALTGHETIIDLAKNFDAAICNTIVCWMVPKQIASYLPVYLYVLETEHIRYMRETVPGFCEGLAAATALWGCGPYIVSKVCEYCGLEALNMESCVEEPPDLPHHDGDQEYPGDVVIALLGTYEPRKGQDLAVYGFKMLPAELRKECRFFMAGRTNDHSFRTDIEEYAKDEPHLIFRNELDYPQVVIMLRRADIVMVPSRDDGGPTTAIDALAAGKILVISATSGISRYLVDGESGFILQSNDPEDICATLRRVFEQRSRWPTIRAQARELYEAHFTRLRFKESVLSAIDDAVRENQIRG